MFWWLLKVLLFNLAMKERHRETARGKQRDACYRREEFKYVSTMERKILQRKRGEPL